MHLQPRLGGQELLCGASRKAKDLRLDEGLLRSERRGDLHDVLLHALVAGVARVLVGERLLIVSHEFADDDLGANRGCQEHQDGEANEKVFH